MAHPFLVMAAARIVAGCFDSSNRAASDRKSATAEGRNPFATLSLRRIFELGALFCRPPSDRSLRSRSGRTADKRALPLALLYPPPTSLFARRTRLLATALEFFGGSIRFKASPRRPRATSMRGALAHPAHEAAGPPHGRHPRPLLTVNVRDHLIRPRAFPRP